MMKKINLVPFPNDAESDGFFAAFSSAVMPCLGITADTPFWCSPKGGYCKHCQNNCDPSRCHQLMLYHTFLTVSGVAFAFDYPEDDSVDFHSMPDIPIGWRWEELFVSNLMDFAGLSFVRCKDRSVSDMRGVICQAIDNGFTALCADTRNIADDFGWTHCWNVVCGYKDDGVIVMRHGGEIVTETDTEYTDWIVITGKTAPKQTYRDILQRIYETLTDTSHDKLEKDIEAALSGVTRENSAVTSYRIMKINGVPVETRWHAAEAFCSEDNLLSAMTEDADTKKRLADLFFSRYIADNNDETHGVCQKIWQLLNVGPATGYMPIEESFKLIQRSEVQMEMKRLWKTVFDNDRAVAEEIRKILDRV